MKGGKMATFITLVQDTEENIRKSGQTLERGEAFKNMAEKMGVTVKEIYWTQGGYDGAAILEAPDAETVMALMLSLGHVHVQTLRAYSAEEMRSIIEKTLCDK